MAQMKASGLIANTQAQQSQAEAKSEAVNELIGHLRSATTIDQMGSTLKALAGELKTNRGADAAVVKAARSAMDSRPDVRAFTGGKDDKNIRLFMGTATPQSMRNAADSVGMEVSGSEFQEFSTGDPFTKLNDDVHNRHVVVVQGSVGYTPKEGEPNYDAPTLVAEALQTAFAARSNGALKTTVVLPESLDPNANPGDAFARLVAQLAKASGVSEVIYHPALDNDPGEVASRRVPMGPRMFGAQDAHAAAVDGHKGLRALSEASSLDEVSRQLVLLEGSIRGLKGDTGQATALVRQVADVLTRRVQDLVPEVPKGQAAVQDGRPVVFTGHSNPELAADVADKMNAAYGESVIHFEGQTPRLAELVSDVAGKDVTIVQTSRHSPNAPTEDRNSSMAMLTEALLLAQSAKDEGAENISLVMPYMPNIRSDKRDQAGVGAYAALVARWVDQLDLGRVVMVEPHDVHVPEMFRTQVNVISGAKILCDHAISKMSEDDRKDLVLVRPDEGATKRTKQLAKELGYPMVNGEKSRAGNDDKANVEGMGDKSDVDGKICLVTDDEIATGGTMRQTIGRLKEMNAREVHLAVSHANMPLDADARIASMRKLKEAGADHLYLLDTQPVGSLPADLKDFVTVVSSAEALAKHADMRPAE